MEIRIDNFIHINTSDLLSLDSKMEDHLAQALSIPNLEKEEAYKLRKWGWERMPDYIMLYCIVESPHSEGKFDFITHRGFLPNLIDGLKIAGVDPKEIKIIDNRKWEELDLIGNPVVLNPWQEPQVKAIISHEQGILKSPPGSGKTVTILETIRRLACKSLVIVNTKDILWQWKDRAKHFLGEDYPVGQIGDGTIDISPYLTVATAQSLHSQYDRLETSGFFDLFSFVCLDECHHANADTYQRIISRFSATYRIGVSATPDKTGDFRIIEIILGPIFSETKADDVGNRIKPRVIRVATDFRFDYVRTENRWRRNNYSRLVSALILDEDRNKLIANKIIENTGCHQIVVSRRLDQLYSIAGNLDRLGYEDEIIFITGRNRDAERKEAIELASFKPCVVLSTVADEALDIPRLDRIHIVYPTRNIGLIEQQIGRIERKHPKKHNAIIYDYADIHCIPLEVQWRQRRSRLYLPRGLKITYT